MDFRSNGPLLATIWVDKKSIYFLSTIHVAESPLGPTCTVKRCTTTGAQEDKPCPPCLPDYQCFMRWVDRNDQMEQYYNIRRRSIKYYHIRRRSIKYYHIRRRSIKWWKRTFYYLVESAILNSFIVESHVRTAEYTRVSARRDYLTFRLELASELIGTFTSRKRLGWPRSDEHAKRTCLNHNLDHYPCTVAKAKRCVVCEGTRRRKQLPEHGNRHESRTLCWTWQVHLCIDDERRCFEKYHIHVDYCSWIPQPCLVRKKHIFLCKITAMYIAYIFHSVVFVSSV